MPKGISFNLHFMKTFHIKTHNRWMMGLVTLLSGILPIVLFCKYGKGYAMLSAIVCLIISLTISYFLFAKTIKVVVSEKSIATTWLLSRYFNKTKYEDVLFEDINSFKVGSGYRSVFEVFTIKKKNDEKLNIQYFNFVFSQKEFERFLEYFNDNLLEYNKNQPDESRRVEIDAFFNMRFDLRKFLRKK